MNLIDAIRNTVKAKRAKYNISLRKAAEYIGINYVTLSHFEQGRPTSAEVFLKIARWVDYELRKAKPMNAGDTDYRDEMETAHVESSPTIASMTTDKAERIDRLIWKIQGMNRESERYEEELKEVRAELKTL